uniref:NADH-ubiquinone oxidoreductase chain 2 n=1 Tax=Helcomeria spinosa TaxID=2813414 RepID=A0A8T9ZY73_9HEMI|nr:NADH dehydrogenase subunit 2 [Helcomeria spinosa]
MTNSSKLLFSYILFASTIITLSSSNWLGMWMGLEMNLMSFIPLISKNKDKKSSQAMIIYFLTQSIGSMLFIFSIFINHLIFMLPNELNEMMNMMIMVSMMIKVGAAPFHFWLPEMMANLDWMKCILLMTWQKVAPLSIMYNLMPNNWFFYLSILLSSMIGGLGGLNQTSLRKIFAYSSINHLSWMMMFMSFSASWPKYLIIYSIMVIMICSFFSMKKIYFINQLNSSTPSITEKFTCISLMLSMGGLPPFLGFFPKWMVIQSMINSEMFLIILLMMMFSLLTLFYYLRIMINYTMFFSTMNKINQNNNYYNMKTYYILIINFMMPALLTMNFM